jgi:hypothetical protein
MLGSQGPTPQFAASDPSASQCLRAHPVIRVRECVLWVPQPQKWILCAWLSRLGTDRPTQTMPGGTRIQPTNSSSWESGTERYVLLVRCLASQVDADNIPIEQNDYV